jgi:hypothetical protein
VRFPGHDFAPAAASDEQRHDQAERADCHQNPADEIHVDRTYAGNVNAEIEGECKNRSDRDQK